MRTHAHSRGGGGVEAGQTSPPVHLDPRRRVLACGEQVVPLTEAEFRVMLLLVLAEGRAVSKKELSGEITRADWAGDGHHVEVHISRLRHKLAELFPGETFILTERGWGYRFVGALAGPGLGDPVVYMVTDERDVIRWVSPFLGRIPDLPVGVGDTWADLRALHSAEHAVTGPEEVQVRTSSGARWVVRRESVEGISPPVCVLQWRRVLDAPEEPPR